MIVERGVQHASKETTEDGCEVLHRIRVAALLPLLPTWACLLLCRCAHCRQRGATLGCRVEKCAHSFHLQCAKAAACTFYPPAYQIACPLHAPAFRHEERQDRCVHSLLEAMSPTPYLLHGTH